MKLHENYIVNLRKEFSLIENGFKEEEKKSLADYKSMIMSIVKKWHFSL